MRANRLSGSEGGAGANPLFLPLSIAQEIIRQNENRHYNVRPPPFSALHASVFWRNTVFPRG